MHNPIKPSTFLLFKLLSLVLFISVSINNIARADNQTDTKWQISLDKITKDQPVKKVGKAKFSVFIWDVYESELSTSSGEYPDTSSEEVLIYKINYLRDVTSKELIKSTIEQWEHLNIEASVYKPFIPELNKIWPDIKSGDSLALVVKQNMNAFYYNNKFIGSIDDAEFAKIFLAIWLSEKTSEPELRNSLLGK